MPLDPTDLRILSALQQGGALTKLELAWRAHRWPSPCLTHDLTWVLLAHVASLEYVILNRLTPIPGIEKIRVG